MTYLLDSNIVSYFLQARRENELADAARVVSCAIVDEVRREVEDAPQLGKRFRAWLPTSHLNVHAILVGSDADVLLNRLQIGLTSPRGQGERASIALAASDATIVLTCMDKGAMWIALRELWQPGERLCSLAVFLRRLVDANVLTTEAAEDVLAVSNQSIPTWWASWLTTHRSAANRT